ncbi:SdpI family protein [Anaerococcus vaginalis]|uniref:SdpI family protein n=1 Tax=Anaerococcus vaginalis TaxID=33037 RepID=UPI00292D26A6|nr:SdpI family protein [Anaerococcus vaginalis]
MTVWKTFNDNIDVGRILLGLFSLLVAISGIFMPKIKRNYTMGFRTSWAMEDDLVWKKTQKFAGILFFFSGIISLTSLSFSLNICFYIFIASLVISTLFSFIYSYYIYRKIKK